MQDRYTGDIGDFAKFGLLRALAGEDSLGIAWYLFPDENHSDDGQHTRYLGEPTRWRHLDPDLFDCLKGLVEDNKRSVSAISSSGILRGAVFSDERLASEITTRDARRAWRRGWFSRLEEELRECAIVFADPDNGLCDDTDYRWHERDFWKRIPLREAQALANDRPAVIYHHNTRLSGGHALEIQYWIDRLGHNTLAIYWRVHSNRTFFILNPTDPLRSRARSFAERWGEACELHSWQGTAPNPPNPRRRTPSPAEQPIGPHASLKACPECGKLFRGGTWGGIDAHWKARHSIIMPYDDAWPLIQSGTYKRF